MGNSQKGIHVSRRGFIKTTALASMAATLPATSLAGQSVTAMSVGTKPSPVGRKRNLLFLSDNPERFKKLIESIQSIKEYDLHVTPIKIDLTDHERVAPLADWLRKRP